MSKEALNNDASEENLNDPAWKPLKSKRQIFEGVEGHSLSSSISNLDATKSSTNISKKLLLLFIILLLLLFYLL